MYDILILGAGPAGISAALYAASRGKKVLILEKSQVGGLIGNVSTVTHYTALLPGETGASFAARMQEQALRAGVDIAFETVTEVSLEGEIKTLHTNKGVYQAPRVILAGGGTPRKLGIPGEQELAGRGIGLNAARDGARYTGKNIYVVGGADGAVKEALYLASFARRLTLIHFEEQLGCITEFRQKVAATPNITLRLGTRLRGVFGRDCVEQLELVRERDGFTETLEDPGCGVFVYAGIAPNTDLFPTLALRDGYILTDENMQTSVPGVYAAGDIRFKQVRQVATAVADGAIAAIHACA